MDSLQKWSLLLLIAVLVRGGHSGNFVNQPFLDINPNAPNTRGSEFFLGFMNNEQLDISDNQIAVFITTEQESSEFTIETRFSGVTDNGFTETAPGSGLYSRTDTATKGKFTVIRFPAGHRPTMDGETTETDIAVQSPTDREKGVRIVATDSSHELTVYALNDERRSTDAYMAISCVSFPFARDYRYFVFSTDITGDNVELRSSRFMVTPCEDNTIVSIRGSRAIDSPADMEPSVNPTDPASTSGDDVVRYATPLNRFQTLMIDSQDDLTGTIIISDKPLSVFVGHQCGQVPENTPTCDYLVEQVPPSATYGSLFFTAPFAVRTSGDIFRIGSIRDGVTVDVRCSSEGSTDTRVVFNDAPLTEGGYIEFTTNSGTNVPREFCCIQSTNPVTVMMYMLSSTIDSAVVNGDPALVYIPPASAYLNDYTITTAKQFETTNFDGYISYILPTRVFDNSVADRNRVLLNGTAIVPDSGYQTISCENGGTTEVCAYGAYEQLGRGEFTLSYPNDNLGAFWAFAYGFSREVSFGYPAAFEMEPSGLALIRGEDLVVLESAGTVTLPFRRVAGDLILRSRAFANTRDSAEGGAIAGSDYTANVVAPGANSNLRWRANRADPNNEFQVTILQDSTPEPVEYLEVVLTCEALENCYAPQSVYRITIIDDDGQCADLPEIDNGMISYDFELQPMRPFGTTATYTCDESFQISGVDTRMCDNGMWTGVEPRCVPSGINVMFGATSYTFSENGGTGRVELTTSQTTVDPITVTVTGGPSTQTDITQSAGAITQTVTIPSGVSSFFVEFPITDDLVPGEPVEFYDATLSNPMGAILGSPTTTRINVEDDDLPVVVMFGMPSYTFTENGVTGSVVVVTDRAAVADFQVNVNGGPSTQANIVNSAAGISQTQTFPAGQSSISYDFVLTDDNVGLEDIEMYIASLTLVGSPVGVVLGAQTTTTVNVNDDDDVTIGVAATSYDVEEAAGDVELMYVLNREAVRDVTFVVTNMDGTATGNNVDYDSTGYTLTIPARQTSVSRNVAVIADGIGGETPPEFFTNTIDSVTPSGVGIAQPQAQVNIIDSDADVRVMFGQPSYTFTENGVTGRVEVITSRASTSDFQVNVNGGPSTQSNVEVSAAGISQTQTIPAGQTSIFFDFALTDDDVGLEDIEMYIASLTLVGSPMGVVLGAQTTTTVNVNDDDVVEAGFVSPVVTVTEAVGDATLGIAINRPAARDVTLNVRTTDGTATVDGDDYTGQTVSVTIPAGQTSVDFTVPVNDDDISELTENFQGVIDSVTPAGVTIGQQTTQVDIIDNDEVVVEFSEPVYSFTENGVTGTVVVTKTGQIDRPFDITVTGGPSTQIDVVRSGGRISETRTFQPDSQTETITFTITDDDVGLEVLERYLATLTIVGEPEGVVLGETSTTEIQIADDDEITVGFEVTTVTVSEDDEMFMLCVTSSGPALQDITVDLQTTDGTAVDEEDYVQSSIPTSIVILASNTSECFEGLIIDDDTPEDGMETFTIMITGTDSDVTVGDDTTVVTIVDDDVGMCLELDQIPNGMVTYSMGSTTFLDGTVATYTCNEGFVLEGTSQRTCVVPENTAVGMFDMEEPQCVPVCMELLEIDNGVISYNPNDGPPFALTTVATYTCNAGYELRTNPGDEMRTCIDVSDSSGGIFDGNEPDCEPVCTVLPDIDNGIITYATDNVAPFVVTTVATYTCNEGYELNTQNGDEMRTCMDNGDGSGATFDGDAPVCDPLCPALTAITNGMITYSPDTVPDYSVGTTATYVCEEGYNLSGNMVRNCQSDGTFDGMDPICTMIPVCQELAPLVNGMIDYSDDERPIPLGTVAEHMCNDGYFLEGPDNRTCVLVSGMARFDEMAPVCTPECTVLPDIDNGVITYATDNVAPFVITTVATYTCNEGYELNTQNGDEMRTCVDAGDGSGGTFDGDEPTCDPVCTVLPDIDNGMITYADDDMAPFVITTVATYTCNEGYELNTQNGDEMRTCMDNGDGTGATFDGDAPVCDPVCTVLPDIDNGMITYATDNVAPFVVTTVATYTCNEGYELNTENGDEMRTCMDNGDGSGATFDGDAPVCDPVCDQLPMVINGEIIYSGGEPGSDLNVGSTATLVCDDGYSPSNEGSGEVITIVLTCIDSSVTGMPGEGGMFNGTLPTCEPVCTVLPDIDNGMITYATDNVAPFVITTVATYTCNEGFILNTQNGDEMRTCMDAGDGTGGAFDGIEPVCDPLCMELPGIDNGFISYDNPAPFRDGTIATYNCDEGFTLVTNPGNEMRTCRSNQIEGVITGATFDGDAPSCESANMTTCIVSEPLMVQPFSRNTAYTFMGTCEHVLLQSCPPEPADFVVSADFITDSMDNGAIGVFMISDERFWISSEDGSLRAYEGANVIINGDSSGDHTRDYVDANVIVTVRPSESYNEIVVGGGVGVTVRHNYGDPASYSVVVNSGSSLASTCGLCGTQDGVLQLKDGSEADITDRNQVTAFTMDYLVPAANQVLRPQRRECGMIRNDTVIGDPLYTVPILNTDGDVDTLCFEVRGRANQMYNLVSDSCVNVNAYYTPMDEPEFGNIMSQIGVRAATLQNECYNIRVARDQCAAFVTPPGGVEVPLSAMMSKDGLSVRTYPNRVRISAPNCDEVTLVMWIICETRGGQDMLKFVISRGVNLRPSSHGLLGQFWNIPVSAAPFGVAGRDDVYSVFVPPSGDAPERNFLAEVYGRTWDKRGIQCLYAGNAQGGPYDAEVDGAPKGSIIQGRYGDYSVDDVFDTTWAYAMFVEENACSV